jgi:hypothetical protein
MENVDMKVLRQEVKTDKEEAVLTSCGRELNIVGAATRKSRVAICSLYLETVRR